MKVIIGKSVGADRRVRPILCGEGWIGGEIRIAGRN